MLTPPTDSSPFPLCWAQIRIFLLRFVQNICRIKRKSVTWETKLSYWKEKTKLNLSSSWCVLHFLLAQDIYICISFMRKFQHIVFNLHFVRASFMSFQSANDPFITYLLICKKFSAYRIAAMVNRAGVMSNAKQTLNYSMLFVLHRVPAHPICSLLFLSLSTSLAISASRSVGVQQWKSKWEILFLLVCAIIYGLMLLSYSAY